MHAWMVMMVMSMIMIMVYNGRDEHDYDDDNAWASLPAVRFPKPLCSAANRKCCQSLECTLFWRFKGVPPGACSIQMLAIPNTLETESISC